MAVNKHPFIDQLHFFFIGLACTAAEFKNICVVRLFFDPELILAVETSHILEEMLERYLREELSSGGCVKLAICLTWDVQCSDEVV